MGPASVSPANEGGSNVGGMRVGRQSWVGRSIVGRTLVGRTFLWVQWPCGGIGRADFRSWIPRAVGIPGLNACEDLVEYRLSTVHIRTIETHALFSCPEHPYCLVLPFHSVSMTNSSKCQSPHNHPALSFGPY
jgi:hypothetical protein